MQPWKLFSRALYLRYFAFSWFHGDITPEETEEILSEAKPGTFLIRFGEGPSTYFCSFVNQDGKVQHVEIRSDGMGALLQEQRVRVNTQCSTYNTHTQRSTKVFAGLLAFVTAGLH